MKKKLISMFSIFTLIFIASCSKGETNNYSKESLHKPLNVEVYHAKGDSIFDVNSEIIFGDKDAIIVDSQFEKSNAAALVEKVKQTGKNVKTIFVTQSDPDFYFGLSELVKSLPQAQIVATPQTVQIIEKSYKEKQDTWNPQLKNEAPERIVIPKPLLETKLSLEGHNIDIKGLDSDDPDHTYLWLPENKLVIGSVSLNQGSHLWLADSPEKFLRESWISRLEDMKKLSPAGLIPGHSVVKDFSTPLSGDLIDENIDYISKFDAEIAKTTDLKQITAYMNNEFPNLTADSSLEMAVNVITGKQEWKVFHSFPGYNRKVHVDFNKDTAFDLEFGPREMSFVGTSGASAGVSDTQPYETTLVGPKTYMVTWTESKTSVKVTHIENFIDNIVYTNIASPDQEGFVNLKGKLTLQ